MKVLGFTLITVAFLAGSLAVVWDKTDIQWNYYITMMAVGVLGVLMARLGHKKTAFHADKVSANMDDIVNSLTRIVENTARLNTEKDSIDTHDMRHRIDELIAADILTFADARESIAALYGLKTYADIMNHFAAGERYLNRTWSASADGYIDEVKTYIEKSNHQFAQALTLTKQAQQNQSPL